MTSDNSSTQRLLRRISAESDLTIPHGTVIRRTYAGKLQRSTGAWSWLAVDPSGRCVCGSHYPVKVLLHSSALIVERDPDTGGVCVDPGEVPLR